MNFGHDACFWPAERDAAAVLRARSARCLSTFCSASVRGVLIGSVFDPIFEFRQASPYFQPHAPRPSEPELTLARCAHGDGDRNYGGRLHRILIDVQRRWNLSWAALICDAQRHEDLSMKRGAKWTSLRIGGDLLGHVLRIGRSRQQMAD
jgi:hypothetical protein